MSMLALVHRDPAADPVSGDMDVELEIERFLSGESDGAVLFEALYGATADEPVPEHLLQLVRSHCRG